MMPDGPAIVRYLRSALTSGTSLADRTVTGGLWVGLLNATDRVVRLGTLILLAGLLPPAEFGLLGLAVLTLAVLRQGSKLGLDAALVHHESEDVDEYLDTVWVLRIARGVVLVAVGFVAAPFVASFFDAPRLVDVVRVVALSPLLVGLRNPGVVYFQKNLEFQWQFVYEISGTIAYALVGIGVALVTPTVWALVAGALATAVVRTTVSFGLYPYLPRPGFDVAAARRMLGYGKWIFGSGLVLLGLNWIDDGFVGWYLGAAALGLYRFAFQLSNAPATEVTQVVSTVLFPAYSEIQDDVDALRRAFVRTVRLVAYASFPAAAGIAAVAPVFVRAFFTPEWEPMVPVIRVLVVWGAFRSIAATIGPLFRAVGRPEYNTGLQTFRLAVLAVVLYPAATRFGLVGVALALVVSALVENPVAMAAAVRQVDGSLSRVVRTLAVPATASLLMGAVVVWVGRIGTTGPALVEFLLLVPLGVAVYVGLLLVWIRLGRAEIVHDLATLRTALE